MIAVLKNEGLVFNDIIHSPDVTGHPERTGTVICSLCTYSSTNNAQTLAITHTLAITVGTLYASLAHTKGHMSGPEIRVKSISAERLVIIFMCLHN